jgi:hypothetical protein
MQSDDGNLVLYKAGTALWSSGAAGGGSRAVMQGDGNFVVYNGSTPKWTANTADFSGASLALQDDGNLVVYHSGHAIWDWGSGYLGGALISGGELRPDAYLLSNNHRYRLVMQGSDGNLVLYDGSSALWSTGAAGGGSRAVMQGDGNFVVYNGSTPKWWSGTADRAGATLALQDDNNLVIYQGGTALWDWSSGLLNGGGGGGGGGGCGGSTPAETAAIGWAKPYADTHNTSYNGLCLTFVFNAYSAAGINLRNWVSVPIGGNTYPADIWAHFTHGQTGTGTPHTARSSSGTPKTVTARTATSR